MSPLHLLCVVAGLLIFGVLCFFFGYATGIERMKHLDVRVHFTGAHRADDSGEEWKRG